MKKKTFFLSLILIFVLMLLSCSGEKSSEQLDSQKIKKNEALNLENKQKEISMKYEKINPQLSLEEDEIETLCYTDENYLVFSVGKKNGALNGPTIDTQYLVVYDCQKKKLIVKYEIKLDSYVADAIPYGEGLLYSYYKKVKAEKETYQWKVVYINRKNQRGQLIDQGLCQNYDRIPRFAILGQSTVYLYENIEYNERFCGVKKVKGEKALNFFKSHDLELLETTIDSNRRKCCFLAIKKNTPILAIIEENGDIAEYEVDGKIMAFDINPSFAMVSLQDKVQENQFSLHVVDLRTKKTMNFESTIELYRLKGGEDSFCYCVDWQFKPYQIDIESGTISRINLPKKYEYKNPAIYFYPATKLGRVVAFSTEEEIDYYYMY